MTTTSNPDLTVVSTEHPNARRMREVFVAFAAGDMETVQQSFMDDATWTTPGNGPLAGTFRGWPEIGGMFGKLMELTGGTFSTQVLSILADDSHAVAIYDATSTVAGVTETTRCVLVDEMAADGRTTASHVLSYDQDAQDRHWSGQSS